MRFFSSRDSFVKRAAVVALGAAAFLASGGAWATDYTWKGGAEGDGQNWHNPTNWGKTAAADYPKTTSDKAYFPAGTDVTVVLTDDVTIHTVQFNKGCSLTIAAGEGGKTCPTLKANGGFTDNGIVNFTLDGAGFYRAADWTPKAGTSFALKNGACLYLNSFALTDMTGVSLSGRSSMSVNEFSINGDKVLTIDDSTFTARSNVKLGTANPGGGRIVFKGARPVFRNIGGTFAANNAAAMTKGGNLDFEVPAGGFAEVPLQVSGARFNNSTGNIPSGYFRFNVLSSSPALSASGTTDCALMFAPLAIYRLTQLTAPTGAGIVSRFTDESLEATTTSADTARALFVTIGSGNPIDPASHSSGIVEYKSTSVARHVITATGWISAVATDGSTSQLELWAGEANNAATMKLADSVQVEKTGPTSLSFTAPEDIGEKTYYFQFRLFDMDGATTNHTVSTSTFSATTKDSTVYTWKAKDGDWTGDWNDPGHWTSDYATADGYPHTENATARFPVGHRIAVTVADSYAVGTVDFSGFDVLDPSTVPDLTLVGGAEGTAKTLTVKSKFLANEPNGQIVIDNLKASLPGFGLGVNRTLRLKNAAYVSVGGTLSHTYGGVIEVSEGSTFSVASIRMIGSASKVVLDDSTMRVSGYLYHAQQNVSAAGGTIVFRGKKPQLYFSSKDNCWNSLDSNSSSSRTVYTFVIPEGGYEAPPISCVSTATKQFANANTRNYQNLYLEVDDNSPCYLSSGTLAQRLVEWSSTGIFTNCLRYVALPDGGTFTYDSDTKPTAIVANVVSVAHNDRLTVATDCDAAISGIVPAVGVTNQSEVAEGGKIAFSAPATYEAGGVRYTLTGYTLSALAKTASGTVADVTKGSDASFEYTPADKEVVLTWHYAADGYKVTSAAVNDAGASVTVTSGYVTDATSVTLSAATTSETMEFQYWYGDVPYAQRYTNPLTLKGARPMSVNAFFGKKAENAATIVATSGNTSTHKSWFATSTWTGGVVPGTNDSAVVVWTGTTHDQNQRFCVDAASFFAVKDLTISNAAVRVNATLKPAACGVTGYGRADAADKTRTEPVGCDIFGNLTVDCYQLDSSKYYGFNRSQNGGAFCVGGTYQAAPTKVIVRGDLTVANGAVWVMAGYDFSKVIVDVSKAIDGPNGFLAFTDRRAFFRGENVLRVLGKTTLLTPTRSDHKETPAFNAVMPLNEFRTGVGVWLDLQDVEVQAKAGFTAYNGGYGKFDATGAAASRSHSMCPGGHGTGDNTSGGSHGGAGGSEDNVHPAMKPTAHVATYDYVNAPIYPGSPNSGQEGVGSVGAGTIRLDCQTLTIDGVMAADGTTAAGNKGGSAGGSIWVVCSQFFPGAACAVTAVGGPATGANSGGGGGRVSICEGLTAEQVEELFTTETHEATDVTVSSLADKLGDRFSVAGGTGTSERSNGYDGTGVYIVNTAGKKTLTVAGYPENLGAPIPAYGPQVVEQGQVIHLVGPEDAYVTDDSRSRRQCVGYVITDVDGEVLVESDSRTGSYTITQDCTLTWKLTTLVHKLAVEATDGGSVTTNQIASADEPWQPDGATISLTADPDAGYAFAGWYGELPTGLQANAKLVFPCTKGRTVKALFVTTSAGAITWTGAGDGTSWEDAANWDSEAIPGAASDVTIPKGANVTANLCVPVAVKSLTVDAGATLTFGPNGGYSTFSKPQIAENAVETDWQRISLTVANDLTVNGTFAIGGKFSLAKFELAVGGSLVFGEQAKGSFYAAFNASDDFLDAPTKRYDNTQADMELAAASCVGGQVKVGGTFSVATNAVVSPWSDFYSGASVRFDVGSLLVANGGKIDADGKGWGYNTYSDLCYSLSPTLKDGNTRGYAGGTYGGVGGHGDSHFPSFKVYGWAYAPVLPGSPGLNTSTAPGGGVVRIHAKGALRCHGTITANGGEDKSVSGGYCGAGGGIFLTGSRLRTSETTVITAKGASVPNNDNRGAGAGGRLVVGTGLSNVDLAELCASGTCVKLEKGKLRTVDLMANPTALPGTITAKGGVNNRVRTAEINKTYPALVGCPYSGEDGTAYLLQGPASGLRLIVR